MHNQLSSYLTKNYNNILVPQLPVKKLVRKWDNKKNDVDDHQDNRQRDGLYSMKAYEFIFRLD